MVGAANDLNINTTGFQTFNQTNGVFNGRTLTAGSSIIITNGNGQAGNPIIASPAFDSINVQVFNTAGSFTYVPTAGMQWVQVTILGGGGGGGGQGGSSGSSGGGGAGEYAVGYFNAATVGINQPVTVGTAGLAGASTGGSGGTGGTTSFGALMTAIGGGGGQTSTSNSGIYGGGGGGGSGGNYRSKGHVGTYGCTTNGTNSGGVGANSQLGSGGVSSAGGSFGGGNGAGFGSGGGGAVGTTVTGGTGAPGICIIVEYLAV